MYVFEGILQYFIPPNPFLFTGEYQIDVNYYGKPITGSPFHVQAFDWNRITIHNLSESGTVGKLIEFDSKSVLILLFITRADIMF